MSTDPRLLPILVIRTADWVAPVRDAARALLPEALAMADDASLLAAVGVALQMRERRRGDAAIAMVTDAIRNASPEVLAAARTSDSLPLRRWAYRIWLDDARRPDLDTLVDTALKETDVICRLLCAGAAADSAVAEQNVEALERLLASRSARLRVEALTALVKLGHAQRGKGFLADRSGLMRATAQWAVRRAGGEPAGLYRAALATASGRDVLGLVAGLGECGNSRDLERVRPFLRHERPRVRAAAVRAFHRLGGPDDQIASMLADLFTWLQHSAATTYTTPSPEARGRLSTLLRQAEPDLGEWSADLLRWHLGITR
jgi:hypothetical protein